MCDAAFRQNSLSTCLVLCCFGMINIRWWMIWIIWAAESSTAGQPAEEILSVADGHAPGGQGRWAEGAGRRRHGRYQSLYEGWTASTCCSNCQQSWCESSFYVQCACAVLLLGIFWWKLLMCVNAVNSAVLLHCLMCIYFASVGGWSIAIGVSVCLSVCLFFCLSAHISQKHVQVLPVVLAWFSSDVSARYYVFPVFRICHIFA